EVFGENPVLGELRATRPAVGHADELVHPQVGGQAGKLQPVVLDFLLQLLPFGLGIMRVRAGMRRKPAQLDSVQAEITQFVNNRVEINVIVLIRPETVSPTADGNFSHGASEMMNDER